MLLARERPHFVADEAKRSCTRNGRSLSHNGRQLCEPHEKVEDESSQQEGERADNEEADRLTSGATLARIECPTPVPQKVVAHGGDKGQRRCGKIMRSQGSGTEGKDRKVDHVAGEAHGCEPRELEPVARVPHSAPNAAVQAGSCRLSLPFDSHAIPRPATDTGLWA